MTAFLKQRSQAQQVLKDATLRDFSGGLNVIDSDLNLDRKYAVHLNNMYHGQDGSQAVRQGTRIFCDYSECGMGDIIGMHYFSDAVVAVDRAGLVGAANSAGTTAQIFNNDIANAQPGHPNDWDPTNYVSFAETSGGMIICNGINKPLLVDPFLNCAYLVDPATSSNFYIPICRYVTLSGRYVVMTGDPTAPSTIYISNRDSYGVFFGSVAPNDGVNINLASRVTVGSSVIKGHATFRDKIIVFFEKCILVGQLGIYTSNVHTPSFEDAVPLFGAIAHNAVRSVGNYVEFPDHFGVQSVSRAVFTGLVQPDRQSALIDPLITNALSKLSPKTIADRVWAVFNQPEQQYMLFIPTSDDDSGRDEVLCFVQTQIRGQADNSKTKPWALFRDWRWRAGCETALGRILFANRSEVFVLGNLTDNITSEFEFSQDTFTDETAFTDGTGWSMPDDVEGDNTLNYPTTSISGVPISFEWILPWADFNARMNTKQSRYIAFDAIGDGRFFVDMFIDGVIFKNEDSEDYFSDNTGWTDGSGNIPYLDLPFDPALTSDFIASGAGGYGADGYGRIYGGGRLQPDETLYAWPATFRLAKFRVYGDTKRQVHIVAISVLYQRGMFRR
jgi:hypothetical protein